LQSRITGRDLRGNKLLLAASCSLIAPIDMSTLPIKTHRSPGIRYFPNGLLSVSANGAGRTGRPVGHGLGPGGEFVLVTDDKESMPTERPAHRIHVDGFWMDATEVTKSHFAKFVTGFDIDDGGLPHEKSGASSKLKIQPQEKYREISALRISCSLRCFARGLWRRRLQHEPPTDPKQKAYRLSAPERGFSLDLRLYGADHSLQKGT
jgi:Sulfatase-modifying factor enzyme 1